MSHKMTLLLVAALGLFRTSYSYAAFQEDWTACQADTDCVQVGGGCGGVGAVNKRYKTEASQYYLELDSRTDCVPTYSFIRVKPKVVRAACRTGKDACKKADGSFDANSACAVKSCVLTTE